MSADQADRPAKQFEQSSPKSNVSDRRDTRLHEQYKPIGLPAVSAAAQFASKAKKKSTQMS